jgi:hypothetical protein
MGGTRNDPTVAAFAAALSPYPWRRFRPELLARRGLAAVDRHEVAELLTTFAGTEPGRWDDPDPVPPHDPRVRVLVDWLTTHPWNGMSLESLSRHLLRALTGAD